MILPSYNFQWNLYEAQNYPIVGFMVRKRTRTECSVRVHFTHRTERGIQAQDWEGRVWEGQFFSSPLDEAYLWAAIRYVEQNPVEAKIDREKSVVPTDSSSNF